MRIVCISDTHLSGPAVEVPHGDVLVHAGDHTFYGDERETYRALRWLSGQSHEHKVLIAGNHDWFFDPAAPASFHGRSLARGKSVESMLAEFPNLTYLCDTSVTIDGVKFYGSPWQPFFGSWAFNFPERESDVPAKIWAKIPDDVEVLVTHSPPHGTLDELVPSGDRKGDVHLRQRLHELSALRLHIFGHIHEGYGCVAGEIGGRSVTFVNASINTREYRAENAPITIDLSHTTVTRAATPGRTNPSGPPINASVLRSRFSP